MSLRQNPPVTSPPLIEPTPSRAALIAETLRIFLRLGCTSFGGPIAHLGYFQNELVQRRRWISEATFADVVALCQFLPGPASSQVCFSAACSAGWPSRFPPRC